MSILSRLFGSGGGGSKSPPTEPVEHAGFRIYPDPLGEGGEFRIAARIEKDIDGETRVHHMVRADVIRDRETAMDASVSKARQMIDQMGVRLFG